MRTIEPYKGYDIEVIVWRVNVDAFTAFGYIRSTKMVTIGLPFEKSFKTGEQYSTEDAAIKAGIAFAKNTIDAARERFSDKSSNDVNAIA